MGKEFDNAIDKVINAIKKIKPDSTTEEINLICLQYFISKTCETEEIFNDNLQILDRYAQNGYTKKKIKRINLMEE